MILPVALNEGGQCDVLFLDFSKAFDKVHTRLLYKLSHYGTRGSLLKWLESFLTNRTQHVILNNCSSHETNYYWVSHRALSWHLYYFYFTLMTFHSVSVIE